MKLHILGGSLDGKVLPFEGPLITIGREESNILTLADPGVSGRHAFIEKIDGKWIIYDTGSTNGVVLDGSKISEKATLENSQTIKIGVVELKVQLEGAPAPSASPAPKAKQEAPKKENKISVSSDKKDKKPSLKTSSKKTPSLKPTSQKTASFKVENSEEMDELMQEKAEQRKQARKMAKLKSRLITAGVLVALFIVGLIVYPKITRAYNNAQQAKQDQLNGSSEEPTKAKFVYKDNAPRKRGPELPATMPLYIQSYPSGATVEIDGKVVGKTPLELFEFKAGAHVLTIYKDGYWATEYAFSHPHNPIQIHTLRQEPFSALVTSEPTGSAVTIGGQIRGHTPYLLRNLHEGYTNVTLRSQGYEPTSKEFEITPKYNRRFINLKHSNKAGAIKVITRPPGVKIFMNGDFLDHTKAKEELALVSDPLELKGFVPGTYQMKISSLDGSEDKVIPITLIGGQVTEINESLWMINSVLTLDDESKVYGFLVSKEANGDVVFSEENGKEKKYKAAQVASVGPATMRDKYGFSDGIEISADRFQPILSTIHDEEDSTDYDDQIEAAKTLKVSSSDVESDIENLDLFEMMTKYKHTNMEISGNVSFVREGEYQYSIVIDNRIECYLEKDDTPEQKEQLVNIQGKNATIKGFSLGVRGLDRIVLINSSYK